MLLVFNRAPLVASRSAGDLLMLLSWVVGLEGTAVDVAGGVFGPLAGEGGLLCTSWKRVMVRVAGNAEM